MFIKKILYLVLTLSVFIFSTCDRLNMYDIASGKSRTAYALANDGVNYTLIVANIHYIKTFIITPLFTSIPLGMSLNEKGEIIVFDGSNTYKMQSNLSTWETVATTPVNYNVFGYNDTYICFDNSNYYIYQLNEETLTWDAILGPASSNSLGMFRGLNSQMFVIEPDGTKLRFYTINNLSTILFWVDIGTSLTNPIGGMQTKNYFYVWTTSYTANSIFRATSNQSTTLNTTTAIGNSFIDLTVTDNDKVYVIVLESGFYYLKQIISDNNYPVVLNLGSSVTLNIDSLDDRHLIISSRGNTSGYNGLIIYDVEDKKIVKHVTSNDIIAMYVLR